MPLSRFFFFFRVGAAAGAAAAVVDVYQYIPILARRIQC